MSSGTAPRASEQLHRISGAEVVKAVKQGKTPGSEIHTANYLHPNTML